MAFQDTSAAAVGCIDLRNFGLTGTAEPAAFLAGQWTGNRTLWLFYRFIALTLVLASYVSYLTEYWVGKLAVFPIYFTHWSMTMLLVYEILAFGLVVVEYSKKSVEEKGRDDR